MREFDAVEEVWVGPDADLKGTGRADERLRRSE